MTDDQPAAVRTGARTSAPPQPLGEPPLTPDRAAPIADNRPTASGFAPGRPIVPPLDHPAYSKRPAARSLPLHLAAEPTPENIQFVVERPLRPFDLLRGTLPSRAHVAVIFLTRSGRLITPDAPLTVGELLWSRIRTVYEVDTGRHQSQFDDEVPSDEEAVAFRAEADVHWKVTNPCRVVAEHIGTEEDLLAELRPRALSVMRRVGRRYGVGAVASAEAAINHAFADTPVGTELGLSTQIFVRLSLNQHLELEQQVQRVRLVQAENERRLVELRLPLYRDAIARGDIEQFAIRIAENPKDIHVVMEAVRADRDSGRRLLVDFLTRLVDSDFVERHEIGDLIEETLRWLNDELDSVLPKRSRAGVSGQQPRAGRQARPEIIVPTVDSASGGNGDRPPGGRAPGQQGE